MANATPPLVARIYALADPRDLQVRYIGVTIQGLDKRLGQHLRDRRDGYRARWIGTLAREGLRPAITELEVVSAADQAAAERKWIAFYRAAGARLVNATDGGPGGLSREKSAAELRKIGEASRRKFQDPRQREIVSRTHRGKEISAEHKLKIGEAATRKWVEYRASGGALSDESRARLSAAAKARKPRSWTPESRARLAESKRQWWAEQKASGEDAMIRQRMREGVARSVKRHPPGGAGASGSEAWLSEAG